MWPNLARFLSRHPLAVVSLAAALSALFAAYAATHLTFTGSRGALAGKESPQRRLHEDYRQEFPDRDPVLVVARGPRSDRLEGFAAAVATRLAAEGPGVRAVRHRIDTGALRSKGLLDLPLCCCRSWRGWRRPPSGRAPVRRHRGSGAPARGHAAARGERGPRGARGGFGCAGRWDRRAPRPKRGTRMRHDAIPLARRFLIPTDGGPASAAAARLGIRLARTMGASVLAVSVVDPRVARGYAAVDLLRYDVRAAAEAQARHAVEAVAHEARKVGVPRRTMVGHGSVPATLLAEARAYRAGLLVMGTRGHTGLKRLVMGRVAAAVAAKAPCPALLVPPAARAGRGRKRS